MLERGAAGQQVERGTSEGVLVGPSVQIGALELLGRAVGGGTHRHVRCGQPADLTKLARDAEVCEQDASSGVGVTQQDVGRFDVTMQQSAGMGVIECLGNGRNDFDDVGTGHTGRVLALQQPGRVGSLDVVHGDPQLAVMFAAVVDADDVLVVQAGG